MNRIQNKIIYDSDVFSKGASEEIVCYGHFNVIHPGHIRYLQYAGGLGRSLCVIVQGDRDLSIEEREYFFSEYERALNLASIQIVDRVIIMANHALPELIGLIKPRHLVVGSEFGKINDLNKKDSICDSIVSFSKSKISVSDVTANNDLPPRA